MRGVFSPVPSAAADEGPGAPGKCREQGSGNRDQGTGIRDQGSGIRKTFRAVQGTLVETE